MNRKCLFYLGETRSIRFRDLFSDSDMIDILVPEVHGYMDHLRNYRLLNKKVKHGSYGAVMVDCPGFMLAQAAMVCKRHHVPLIYRMRGNFDTEYRAFIKKAMSTRRWSEWLNYKIEYWLTRSSLRKVDLFLTVSYYLGMVLDKITSSTFRPFYSNRRTFHNSSEKFLDVYSPEWGQSPDILVVTNLNFPEKVRAVYDHIEDLVVLLKTRPELRLRILAIGRGFDDFKSTILELVDNRIKVSVEHKVDDMANAYRCAHILVYLSYLDAFPNTVIEAQAAGVPVVSTYCCGMKEQIEHGTNGLFIMYDGDLVTHCNLLLDNKMVYEHIRNTAHAHCKAKYSRSSRIKLFWDIVNPLIKSKE